MRLDRTDDVDEPLPERVRLTDPGDQPLGEVPVRADQARGEDAGAVADHLGVREVPAQRPVRPDRGDPLAADGDRTVAQVPLGPDVSTCRARTRRGRASARAPPCSTGHYFADVPSPMAGLMYSLV